jgi:hypothetical protein
MVTTTHASAVSRTVRWILRSASRDRWAITSGAERSRFYLLLVLLLVLHLDLLLHHLLLLLLLLCLLLVFVPSLSWQSIILHRKTHPNTSPRVLSLYSRGGYEDALFEQQVMEVVEKHPPSSPLFLFWAPHIVHTPLQVPQHFLDKFAFMEETDKPTHNRQIYHSMVRQHNTQCPLWAVFGAVV